MNNIKKLIKKTSIYLSITAVLVAIAISFALPISAATTLTPGGMTFGVKLQTDGVLVVGISDITGISGKKVTPGAIAGLLEKDIIKSINGREINTVDELTKAISSSEGRTLGLVVERDGSEMKIFLVPVKGVDGSYKAGLWVRDSTAGIGTVTYFDKQTGEFAGLGHGICDADTGTLMPLRTADVTNVHISSIVKGQVGAPGEIRGYLTSSLRGILLGNTECGVHGRFNTPPSSLYGAMEVAELSEVKLGDASLLCTLADGQIGEYKIKIEKINESGNIKNFVVKVTDPTLLERTGGIVQGMSGSPILQNGKLVGAITHVMVNDPKSGYGIYIGNMLDAANG